MSIKRKNFLIFFAGLLIFVVLTVGFASLRLLLNINVVNDHPTLRLQVTDYPALFFYIYGLERQKTSLFNKQTLIVFTNKAQKQHQTAWKDETNNNFELLGTSGDYSISNNKQVFTIHIADYPRINNDLVLAQQIFNNQFLDTTCQGQIVQGILPANYVCSKDFSEHINLPSNRVSKFLKIRIDTSK